jgi:hypothetical protein
MAKCRSKTKSGKLCEAQALRGEKYCFAHDPGAAVKRARARKCGGLNRRRPHSGDASQVIAKPRTIEDTLTILDYALAESLNGENGTARNRVLVSIAAAYVDTLSVGELESRLAQLEQLIK